uniref:Semaphorin 3F n=1 Tax=Petromyzon marinus TaxID=7757 RepID=S4RG45_PETMA
VFCLCLELVATQSSEHLHPMHGSSDYHILLMDEDKDRIYIGAKDYVYSLDMNNISRTPLKVHWPVGPLREEECKLAGKNPQDECGNFVRVVQSFNRTHLYICGTGAFQPICTFITHSSLAQGSAKTTLPTGGDVGVQYSDLLIPDLYSTYPLNLELKIPVEKADSGRGKCSYSPKLESISFMANEELYSAVYTDFMATDAAIFKTMGRLPPIRSDQYNSKWLNEPVFLAIQRIPESSDRNDDKLYFFFREKSANGGTGKTSVSRIGRICLNDAGGQRSLVNKWSTFVKARLVCSVTDNTGIETHFDELQDVFILNTEDMRQPIIYGLFSTAGSVFKGSAICIYSMAEARQVFNGPFAQVEGPGYQQLPYQGKIPYPRPGTCPGGTFTPYMKSTKDFPEEVANFIRNHPLMYNPIYPIAKKTLIMRVNTDYKITKISVDRVVAGDGTYDVLFLGTDIGTVQKITVLPKHDGLSEELFLEEVDAFKVPTPILSMKISSKKQQLFISSAKGITQLALHHCGIYGKACAECCLARDPYCAWDGQQCSRYYPTNKRRRRRQDIRHGNPLTECKGFNVRSYREAVESRQFGVEGSSVFLECMPRSAQVSVKWIVQRHDTKRKKEVIYNSNIMQTERGLLFRVLHVNDSGTYYCLTVEYNFKHTVAKYSLRVMDIAMAGVFTGEEPQKPWHPSHPSSFAHGAQLPYKDFSQLHDHPGILAGISACQPQRQPEAGSDVQADERRLKEHEERTKRRDRSQRHRSEGIAFARN